ncbi:flavin-containing monooxygenase [Rhodococcus sp. IEGM 1408]|uniref:flavin-containing monooxygenase n=1 Tax=Rhodococcus sp. IEGM 1408 TaxID=3082220 RepID=UPI002953F274|nr:NAD(P)-binding domain-containing protein [Rhodococcus sp. IEGM 1408]MDV8000294.1 NAD(P)-binding domain-containing protein [Rhodococcus sp. IEGM 1408]
MVTEQIDTVVIGAGQAGLAVGYYLAQQGRPFVLLEENARVGDSWRQRWDSLRLFTAARFDELPGSPYPGAPWSFPTREEFSDYLENYATEHHLAIRLRTRVRRLARHGSGYIVEIDGGRLLADHVIVAAGFDRLPRTPDFAVDLGPGITQLHSSGYRNADQLPDGDVLVVGAGNSGADIALDLSGTHQVHLSGRHPGQIPFDIDRPSSRIVSRVVFAAFGHVLTTRTPMGRRARAEALAHSGPLIRVKSEDLAAAGVHRVPRVTGVREGRPELQDGSTLPVASVIWCTGYRPDRSWIDLPVFGTDDLPAQERGVCPSHPGLYFLGELFQYSLASSMIHGVVRDARYVARHLDKLDPVAPVAPVAAREHSGLTT